MRLAYLKKRLAFWTGLLRLDGWDIGLTEERHWDLDGVAKTNINLERKEAWISILTPDDVQPNALFPYEPERTLIHELLHIALARMIWEERTDIDEEQVCHTLSKAFWELYQKTKGRARR